MKTILFETNYNGKLACDRFVHIDLAPEKPVPANVLENTVIEIQVADKSHPPVCVKVDSIIPFRIGELSNIHTWPSHGMDNAQFLERHHLKKPVNRDTQFAVYYYRRVDPKNVN